MSGPKGTWANQPEVLAADGIEDGALISKKGSNPVDDQALEVAGRDAASF